MHPSAFVSGTRVPAVRILLLLLLNKVHVTVMANRSEFGAEGCLLPSPARRTGGLCSKTPNFSMILGGKVLGLFFFFSSIYMYLAALGLSYSTQGLQFSLQHAGSLS